LQTFALKPDLMIKPIFQEHLKISSGVVHQHIKKNKGEIKR
jgi:hypothetical protein